MPSSTERSRLRLSTSIGICAWIGLLAVCAPPAQAATITINDLGDTLSFTDTTGGRVLGSCAGEVCNLRLLAPAGSGGVLPTFTTPLNILENGTNAVSDTFTFGDFSTSTIFMTFQSDSPENSLAPLLGAGFIFENGMAQEAGHVTWTVGSPSIQVTDTILFMSDVETSSGIPEPGSLLLFGGGLTALGCIRHRPWRWWGKFRAGQAHPADKGAPGRGART